MEFVSSRAACWRSLIGGHSSLYPADFCRHTLIAHPQQAIQRSEAQETEGGSLLAWPSNTGALSFPIAELPEALKT